MQSRLVIRKSKRRLFGFLVIAFVMLLSFVVSWYENTGITYTRQPVITIVYLLVFTGLVIYFLYEFTNQKPYITLTDDGIELRRKGFFNWNAIESFSTREYQTRGGPNYYLELHFKKKPGLEFDVEDLQNPKFPMIRKAPPAVEIDITDLDESHVEIISLIMQSKGSSSVYYAGHHTR